MCDPGSYCDDFGLIFPSGKCSAGYFCGGGSAYSNPQTLNGSVISYSGETCIDTSKVTLNDVCPPGHYCPEGSISPKACPPGTNTSSIGIFKYKNH